jgi:hypothetical protein
LARRFAKEFTSISSSHGAPGPWREFQALCIAYPGLTEHSCRPAAMHTICIHFRLEFIFLHNLDHLCAVCEIIFGDSRMGAVRHKKWKNSLCCTEDRPEARLAKSRNLQCCGGQTIVGSQVESSLWTELQVSGTRSRLRPSRKLRLDNL